MLVFFRGRVSCFIDFLHQIALQFSFFFSKNNKMLESGLIYENKNFVVMIFVNDKFLLLLGKYLLSKFSSVTKFKKG